MMREMLKYFFHKKRKCYDLARTKSFVVNLFLGILVILNILSSNVCFVSPSPLPSSPCDKTRQIFKTNYGEISDGPAGFNYTQDSHCEWLIKAQNDSQFITLKFRSMGTECSYDYIFVYDGDSFRSPLLGSFSGNTEPQKIVAASGNMLILLYSDTNYVLDGFKAEFSVTNCPNNCTNQGVCINHKCVCTGDWVAPDCSQNACPDNCGASRGRGECRRDHCSCNPGYSGQSCSLEKHKPVGNVWHWLSNTKEGLSPRAAHSAVYLEESDSLYVFGGYDLNNVLGSLQIYRFKKNLWEDEWGIKLRPKYFSKKLDQALLRSVLRQTDNAAEQFGIRSEASLFRNILLSVSDSNWSPRHTRSADINVETEKDLTSVLQLVKDFERPSARYGHAACGYRNGFLMYGGKLDDGSLSNDLWYYNVTDKGGSWYLRAINSTLKPPKLTRHTLTLAGDDFLYLFGGSTEFGEFSSRLFKVKLSDQINNEQWEEVISSGGKVLDIRVVAHTTVYHRRTNSLIVYGGVIAGVARFSKLSDRMFAFQIDKKFWTEILYPRTPLRDEYIPRERAFHTTTILGNYLIVFGGYSHRHNKEEICYDNQMFLYHLGCHTWINQDVLGKKSAYPKVQGVFAHAAAVRQNNTLLIVAGYHGNVNGDLLAYTLPQMFTFRDEESFDLICIKHTSVSECVSDPECGWCSADSICYGRMVGGANCTTNLQTTRCPGICPALSDCHSCLIHGTDVDSGIANSNSVADKLFLSQCTWCVQNARCHHKDDLFGVCGEDTIGWWGQKGTEILSADHCTELDRRPGLTFLKYLHPVNWTMPDQVSLINATVVDFNNPTSTTTTEQYIPGEMVARLIGFIRPPPTWTGNGEKLLVCASHSHATLMVGYDDDIKSQRLVANITADKNQCSRADWPSLESKKITVDFQAKRAIGLGYSFHQHSYMGLQHNKSNHESARAFTFEYLEPYSNGSCTFYTNCMHCLSDSMCGWCDLTNECLLRRDEAEKSCRIGNNWKYLELSPSQCANCSNYISCDSCIDSGICEWWAEDARCSRFGRSSKAVKEVAHCPAPCYVRPNCSSCLEEKGRCVWCEATQQCFSFSVYTSEYQFGMCREWIDQVVHHQVNENPNLDDSNVTNLPQQQCVSCSMHRNCSSCLSYLGCGWCFDRDYPIEGVCMRGDFNRSISDCGAALNTTSDEAEWAYATCPDVDECGLGLHDCHQEAKCTNTHGSFSCQCRRGFIGDGKISCLKTCFEICIHGYCQGAPDYTCNCDLGWTGPDCSQNCMCNNHSKCETAVGKCDECENWTEGEFCERCRPGSFGNATTLDGCSPCECNGHGKMSLGVCDVQTGECYCQDNTVGLKCEMCDHDFYGDPKDGGNCYYQCAARGLLKNVGIQGIGSYQRHKPQWGGLETRECLWILSPHSQSGSLLSDSLIQLHIEKNDLNISCENNAVYVYDGLPDLTGSTQQSQLLAVYCSQDGSSRIVEGRSGHMTIHYKQGPTGQGFNAMYSVQSCTAGTCLLPRRCDEKGRCICPDGWNGPNCTFHKCPNNCSFSDNTTATQGTCDTTYGRCLCFPGFGGPDCSAKINNRNVVFSDLFNSQLLSDNLEHLRKTLPRFGHTLITDKRGSLWMFGGYSLSNGPLNDIRQFDTKNSTWVQVTVNVETTPDGKMPIGRYFHAAEILHTKQIIYIYGGLTIGKGGKGKIRAIGDFWSFSLQNQRWDEIESKEEDESWPPPLAGHSITLVKCLETESLVIIGGFSIEQGLNNDVWSFNLITKNWTTFQTTGAGPSGIYGHTSVFHAPSQIIYVYGGYEFWNGATKITSRLYALHIPTLAWSELPPFYELNRPNDLLPRARFLHSAITTENYMIVYGGQTEPLNSSDILIAYIYKCNQWVRLTQDVEIVGQIPTISYAQAMAFDAKDSENNAIFVVGGWDGSSKSRVSRINIPTDLCELWSSGKYLCRRYMGCSFCSVQPAYFEDSAHCFTIGRRNVCSPGKGTLFSNQGVSCDNPWFSKRNCSSFDTCTSCLSSWESQNEKYPVCVWCDDCGKSGQCLFASENKTASVPAGQIGSVNECPSLQCQLATDCESCGRHKSCVWATDSFTIGCYSNETVISSDFLKVVEECAPRCYTYTNCSSCLSANTSEGGANYCRWSTQLDECISPSFTHLYCVGGVCGLVLQPEEKHLCPEPCRAFTQCSKCLKHAHCGWCARTSTNGDGICTEGPAEYPAISTCDIIYASYRNISTIDPTEKFSWTFVECPAENECLNDHHNCDKKSERCVDMDTPDGYKCECGDGFKAENGRCIPVCSQGCVRGNCVEPNRCDCDFGYVGANCSIQCQCNGHSDCQSPDRLKECIECHNNTMGQQCEKCKPLFVGDPRNNGECVPCDQYCNGHTDVCVDRDSDSSIRNMSRSRLESFLNEGPTHDAVCLRCSNKTEGNQCETCLEGHFRGTENHHDSCRPCQCHGHGEICDPVSGEKCNCGNNTESDGTCSLKNSPPCWKTQCSKCKETYFGNPVDGHQCYKQITVESKMCFDAKTIDECKIIPTSLKPGQTVFFAVQPRFMNVDIRIIIDVTQGELELYMSPQDDSFIVQNNETTGHHQIFLDNRYKWMKDYDEDDDGDDYPSPLFNISPPKMKAGGSDNTTVSQEKLHWMPFVSDCRQSTGIEFYVKDVHAKELSTYVTLDRCNTLLRVFGLRNRLVITLPQNSHNLSATKFYMVLKASASSYGLIFFRQDQLHIDLFVFFSVFFSCFFLFLAICVVAWKAKQAADLRRARRRQVVEMLHMAKRPNASIILLLGSSNDTPQLYRRGGGGVSNAIPSVSGLNSRHHIKTLSATSLKNSEIRPVSIEPTADGLASVCTVFISLPGKSKTSMTLGSALTSISRQYPPSNGRAFLRRRGSNQNVPPNN